MQSLQLELWTGDTTQLTQPATKGIVPIVKPVALQLQALTSDSNLLVYYCVLQIVKSQDKDVIMRALATATAHILGKKNNFTGSTRKPEEITGLSIMLDESVPEDAPLVTNFEDAEPVTKGELALITDADIDEVGSYLGVLFIAGNKKMTSQNRTAFNERRAAAATASVIGPPVIFVANSPLLDDAVIQKMYACFNARQPIRAHMTIYAISCLPDATMGAAQSFASMFLLLADIGMGGLRSIRVAMGMHVWTRHSFPELKPAIDAANTAFKLIKTAPADQRPFLKAIHGNHFVPVAYNQIEGLVGVCKHVLTYHSTTFANYAGGVITDHQIRIVESKMAELGLSRMSGDNEDNAE